MPQSTNLNTPPYFEDFDPNKNFHKVLFRPGYPLQARELTSMQSILQNQIEKFGSSIYKEGAMVIPGQIMYDLEYNSLLIEDEYFGVSSDSLVDYIVGQVIIGNSSGVRAKVVKALTSEESEKNYTTLYVKYLSASTQNLESTFDDDEILITENTFSIGTTVIQENTDFAKCISNNATYVGSAAKITKGVYYTKGFFVDVNPQEIVLDQFGINPSYKVGLQILEEIVTPEEDSSLNDPSQGYSNYSAPGAHRFKLSAILTKKALDDNSVTDFIELLRLENGFLRDITVDSDKAQLAKTLEETLARRTADESGDYEVKRFNYSKNECLDNGVNNGIYKANAVTAYGNVASDDFFEISVGPGKAYVSGFEVEKKGYNYIDVEKPRAFESRSNFFCRTDARGVEFKIDNTSGTQHVAYSFINASINNVIPLLNTNSDVIGYGILKSYEENQTTNEIILRIINIKFVQEDFTIQDNIKKVRIGGTIDYRNNSSAGGAVRDIASVEGNPIPYIFPVYAPQVVMKSVTDEVVQRATSKYVGVTNANQSVFSIGTRQFTSTNASDYTIRILDDTDSTPRTITNVTIVGGVATFTYSGTVLTSAKSFILFGPETISEPKIKLASHERMKIVKLSDIPNKYKVNNYKLNLGVTRVSKVHAIYNTAGLNFTDVVPTLKVTNSATQFKPNEIFAGRSSGAKGRVISQSGTTVYFVYETSINFVANEDLYGYASGVTGNVSEVVNNGNPNIKKRYKLEDGQRDQVFEYSHLVKSSRESVISGDIYVVFDYFKDQNTDGLFYTINSYYDSNLKDIPVYKRNGSNYYLSEFFDWRVNKNDIYNTSTFGSVTSVFQLDSAKIRNFAGEILSLLVTDGSSGFTDGTVTGVAITGGSGTGATVDVTVSGGEVTSVTNLVGGLDFQEGETVGLTGYSGVILTVNTVTYNNELTSYSGTTSNEYVFSPDYMFPSEATIADIEYYLSRIDKIYLSSNGAFVVKQGTPSATPSEPEDSIVNAMPLFQISMPAYVRDLNDITISRFENKRYTMQDIGKLEARIGNMEYYTALSLLENDTANQFIDDGTGSNRLKNGFMVDNFKSHDTGDVFHPNYKCSLDTKQGHLRPQHYTKNVSLIRSDVEASNKFVKGSYVMLDYTDVVFVDQPFAAVIENVNPFQVISWEGVLDIFPASDDWFDEERIPESVTEVEGDFLATIEAEGADPNTGIVPTEWNAWETQWSGTHWGHWHGRWWWHRWWHWGWWGHHWWWWGGWPWRTTVTHQTRTGIATTVNERWDREVQGDKTVEVKSIRWLRSRNITVNASSVKPNIRMYPFFADRDVAPLCTPKVVRIEMEEGSVAFQQGETVFAFRTTTQEAVEDVRDNKFGAVLAAANDRVGANYDFILDEANYTVNSTYLNLDLVSMQQLGGSALGGTLLTGDTVIGSQSGATATVTSTDLITDAQGQCRYSFYIPNPNNDANPRWPTGENTMLFTGDPSNTKIPGITDSSAEGIYSAVGNINVKQLQVNLVRNAEVVRDTVTESRTLRRTWRDPLAQSFLVNEPDGIFITKLDLYFQGKDKRLPITLQIRNMINGVPGLESYGSINLNPEDINVSDDASVPTTFVFENPIYLKDEDEYCFVLLTSSLEYEVWLSEMGQTDLSGNRITKQPYLGVLFKSQNGTTWTTADLQDFKFTLYRASFKTNESAVVTFTNDNSGNLQSNKLRRDPIELNVNNGRIKVHHVNHGHHDNSSFVTIRGVSSEKFAKLNSDWSGTPGTTLTVKGDRDPFANITLINGSAPSSTNPAFLRINSAVYSYEVSQVGNIQPDGTFTILTKDLIEGAIPSDGFKTATTQWEVESYIIDGVPLTYINKTHSELEWITFDSYQINLSDVVRTSGENQTVGGDNVFATQNIVYTQVKPTITISELPETSIVSEFRATSGTSLDTSGFSNPASTETPEQASYVVDSEYRGITLNQNNEFDIPKVIASNINEERQMFGTKSCEVRLTLSSSRENLSPVVNLERLSLTTTSNRVANFDGPVENEYFLADDGAYTDIGSSSVQDWNPANYVTKLITLENTSTSLKVQFSAQRRPETDFDVYIKLLSGDEDDESVGWTELTSATYDNSKANNGEFIDYSYFAPDNVSFNKYRVKIRMRSSNQAVVPVIKDLRCIALA
jgi:hypothetical protein